MNPSSSLHGLNIVRFQVERQDEGESPVSSRLTSMLPVRAEAEDYGRWKLAAMVMVALPIVLWLLLALLD